MGIQHMMVESLSLVVSMVLVIIYVTIILIILF